MISLSNKNIPFRTYGRSVKKEPSFQVSSSLQIIPPEYVDVCRLCLDKTNVMLEIFGCKESDPVPLQVKIKSILSLEVREEDQMPNTICHHCLHELNEAYNFKKRCLAADGKLRQVVAKWLSRPEETGPEECFDSEQQLSLSSHSGRNSDEYPEEINEMLVPVEDEMKHHCTFTWDDEVPFASIIMSQEEAEYPLSNPYFRPSLEGQPCPMRGFGTDLPLPSGDEGDPIGIPHREQTIFQKNKDKQQQSEEIDEDFNELHSLPLARRLIIEESNEKSCCYRCKTVIIGDENYKKHLDSCASGIQCMFCPKTFGNKSVLARHMRTHSGDRPFRCTTCDKDFTQKSSLGRHVLLYHSRWDDYDCQYCDKSFPTENLLSLHHRHVHSSIKYQCKHCSKEFRYASGLSRHQKFHNGIRYSCKICQKRFADMSSVRRHLKVHSKYINFKETTKKAEYSISPRNSRENIEELIYWKTDKGRSSHV